MRLLLTVISEEQVDLGHRVRCEFDQKGGTIGRNGNCHWVLPDPTNTLSARHALVSHNGRGFLITDTSTNGVYLNSVDAPIGRGNEAVLSDGDTLYFGHHVISVEFLPDKAPEREQPRAATPIGDGIPSAPRAARPPLSFDLPAEASFPSAPAPWEQQPQPVPAVRPAARHESWAGPREPGLNGTSAASMDDLLGRAGPARGAARAPQVAPLAPISTGPSPPPVIPPAPPPQPAPAPRQPAPLLIPDDFLSDLLGPPMPGPPRATGSMRDTGPGSAGIPDAADFGLPPPQSPRATAAQNAPAPDPFRASPLAHAAGETGPVGMPLPPGRSALPPEPKATTPELPRWGDERAPGEERAFRAPPRKSLSDDMVTLRQPGQEEPADGLSALDPVAILRRRGTAGAARPLAAPDLAADLIPSRQAPAAYAVPVQPPRPRAPEAMPLPGPASSRSAAAVSSSGASASAASFWQALGVDAADLPPAHADRLLGELGLTLREALNGMVPVLAARRSLKDALRMEQTQLQGHENNPLKFLPSGDAVLQALMAQKLSGFMSLSQAVAQGFRDIKAHEVAAVVSLQAVIKNLIGRFDPAALEAQAGSGKLFGRGADKGRLWDQFVSLHASLAGKSDETTRKIVNEEFSRAYAEQVQNSGNGDQ